MVTENWTQTQFRKHILDVYTCWIHLLQDEPHTLRQNLRRRREPIVKTLEACQTHRNLQLYVASQLLEQFPNPYQTHRITLANEKTSVSATWKIEHCGRRGPNLLHEHSGLCLCLDYSDAQLLQISPYSSTFVKPTALGRPPGGITWLPHAL